MNCINASLFTIIITVSIAYGFTKDEYLKGNEQDMVKLNMILDSLSNASDQKSFIQLKYSYIDTYKSLVTKTVYSHRLEINEIYEFIVNCDTLFLQKLDSTLLQGALSRFENKFEFYKSKIKNRKYLSFIRSFPIWVDSIKHGKYVEFQRNNQDSITNLMLSKIGNVEKLLDAAWIKYFKDNQDNIISIATLEDSISTLKYNMHKLINQNKILTLEGNVIDISGTTVLIFGYAYSTNCNSVDDCNDESNPGAVHIQENLQLTGFKKSMKSSGMAVAGEPIIIKNCIYTSKSSGSNRIGGTIQIRNYQPTSFHDSLLKIDSLLHDVNLQLKSKYREADITKNDISSIMQTMDRVEKILNIKNAE